MGLQFHKDNFTRQWDYKSFGNMGTSLNPGQANQLQQLNNMISSGQGGAEVITLQKNIWETIPLQHFDEMRRLSTLTGFEPTIHAPLIEPSGLTQGPGGGTVVSEETRRSEGRHINEVLNRAVQLVDLNNPRNISVNVHPSMIPGPIYRIAQESLTDTNGNLLRDESGKAFREKGKEYLDADFAVDPESGQMVPLKFEVKYRPAEKVGESEKIEVMSPQEQLKKYNKDLWKKQVMEAFSSPELQIAEIKVRRQNGQMTEDQADAYIERISENIKEQTKELFDDLKKHAQFEPHNWELLTKSPDWASFTAKKKEDLESSKKLYENLKQTANEENIKISKNINEAKDQEKKAINETEKKAIQALRLDLEAKQAHVWDGFFKKLRDESDRRPESGFIPSKLIPLEEFSMERTSRTFAEAAVSALEEAGRVAKKKGVNPLDIVPMVNIENMPANQQAFGRAVPLARLVEETRIKTADALERKGYSRAEAVKVAEKIVGATWDVGHINMLRAAGYEEKDIIEEAKKIAPLVRHFHITDNFGSTDSHLAPGQGNAVPTKQVEAIRKAAAEAGAGLSPQTKEIMEIGGFVEHQRVSPWPDTLSYMNSPIYETEATPAWSDTSGDIGSSYFSGSSSYVAGYGNILPEQHFGMYGSGFTGLPVLGGQMGGGDKSKFTGTPMS